MKELAGSCFGTLHGNNTPTKKIYFNLKNQKYEKRTKIST